MVPDTPWHELPTPVTSTSGATTNRMSTLVHRGVVIMPGFIAIMSFAGYVNAPKVGMLRTLVLLSHSRR
jgi:hypothetical protein